MSDDVDQATHASGKRNAESASSDLHRLSHARIRTVGEPGADPQELDTRSTEQKQAKPKRRFSRNQAERSRDEVTSEGRSACPSDVRSA